MNTSSVIHALRKYSALEKTASFNPIEGMGKAMGKGFQVAASPFVNKAKSMAAGGKVTSGVMKGTRWHARPGGFAGGGWSPISASQFKQFKSGKLKGEVTSGKVGGKKVYFKRNYTPGGVAGVVARNPGKSAVGAGLLYMLGASPKARAVGGAFLPDAPKSAMTEDTMRNFGGGVSGKNPLNQAAWG